MDGFESGPGPYGEDRGTDSLTGLGNRLALDRWLNEALLRGATGAAPALFFFDLDEFRPINERYGHQGGDQLLVALADRLQVSAGPAGRVFRVGGGQFIVLWSGSADRHGAAACADRLLELVRQPLGAEELPTDPLHREGVIVTASVGVAIGTPHVTADDLLRSADRAMYGARRHGPDPSGSHGASFEDLPPET